MKKIVSIISCICSLFLTNVCAASSFGNKIALNCLKKTASLKMTTEEIKEWEKGGIEGDAILDNESQHFYQSYPNRGICVEMLRSNRIYTKVARVEDGLVFYS